MKKIIISVALCLSMGLTSCKEFLAIDPIDTLKPETALQTYQEYTTALGGAYASLTQADYYGGEFIGLADIAADNMKYGPNVVGFFQGYYELNYVSANTEFLSLFRRMYQTIYRANTILELLPKADRLTDAQKNQLRAECLMIRALAHHDLVRTFARRYKATGDASHPGIPIKTTTSLNPLPRKTVKEVYDQIIADINEATPILPTAWRGIPTGTAPAPTHFTKNAADAFRARIALYMEDWATAESFATTAISQAPAMASGTTYSDMWAGRGEGNGEVIFRLEIAPNAGGVLGTNFWNAVTNTARYNPVSDLVASYDVADVRYSSFFRTHTSGFVPKKYEGTSTIPGLVDVKILRTSELYLIRAEARYRNGNESGALADLNALRTARGISTGTETGTVLLAGIRNERRKELFFEGHRWFDLIRDGLPVLRFDCNSTRCQMDPSDFRFTMPIPQSEILANPQMEQNPGY